MARRRLWRNLSFLGLLVSLFVARVVPVRATACVSEACECTAENRVLWSWSSGTLDCGAPAEAYCESACSSCYGFVDADVISCDDNPEGGLSLNCQCVGPN